MEIFTKVSGKRGKLAEMGFLSTSKDLCTRASGKMTHITEKELSSGTITKLYIQAILSKDKKQERENLSLMATCIRAILSRENSTGTESTISLSLVKSTRANSRRIICTEKVNFPGLITLTMRAIFKMVKWTDMASEST